VRATSPGHRLLRLRPDRAERGGPAPAFRRLSAADPEVRAAHRKADLDGLSALLSREIPEALEFAERCRETFTFFGGARVRTDDPAYRNGVTWGEAVTLMNLGGLAGAGALERAIAMGGFSARASRAALGAVLSARVGLEGAPAIARKVRIGGLGALDRLLQDNTTTGAGPGMMEAVPVGVRAARKRLEKQFPALAKKLRAISRTQGARIVLEFEQRTNDAIELIQHFSNFLARRLALTEHAAGFVVFPGGFGTLNELFEVLRGDRPLVFDGRDFWGAPIGAILDAWRKRGFVSEGKLARLAIVDGPEEGLRHLLEFARHDKAPEPSVQAGLRMARDAGEALGKLAPLPSAVTFIGSRRLEARDREIEVAGRIAERLADRGVPVRIGGDGALLDAISAGVRRAKAHPRIQALLLDEGQLDVDQITNKCDIAAITHFAPVHKLVLYENTDAIVALPGGIGTFDEVFEVATLMQTKKIPKRPLILVGREFWQPILEAIENATRRKGAELIGPDDMKLFHVVDSEEEALALLAK
jgi:uncharacterized protein (TIGR00730 family)